MTPQEHKQLCENIDTLQNSSIHPKEDDGDQQDREALAALRVMTSTVDDQTRQLSELTHQMNDKERQLGNLINQLNAAESERDRARSVRPSLFSPPRFCIRDSQL